MTVAEPRRWAGVAGTKALALPRLRPYQVEAGRAIVDSVLGRRGLTLSVVMARQAGKNELSAQVELFLLLKHARLPADGIKCAPTFRPQARISLHRLWARITQAGLRPLAALEAGHAVRVGRARQLFLSAAPGASVVGHTASILLEVDEAQDVDAEKFERDFRPMAAPAAATIVYYGTPWDDFTLLERAVQAHLELERRDGLRRHFQFDWTDVARFNPAYGRFVEAERARLGENHPLFRTQYALKTIPNSGRLLTPSQRAQLQGTHPRQGSPRAGEMYVAGLDLGGQDLDWDEDGTALAPPSPRRDATVLTIARAVPPPSEALIREPRLEVVEHLAVTGEPHDTLLPRLADLLSQVWRVRRLAVDASGLGETLARLLTRALSEKVVKAVRFTGESKSRLGFQLLAAVNGGRLKMYAADGSQDWMRFWREMELARVTYRPNRTMNFFVEPWQGHDDYLMSLALTVEAARDLETRPRVARGRAPAMR